MKYQQGTKVLFAGLGIAFFAATSSHAAFTSLSRSTVTAEAVLTGAGAVTMSLAIKKVADGTASDRITWPNVTLPARWVVASDYVELNSVVTASGGGIQTYTDNTATDASPRFTGNLQALSAAGLVDTTDTTKKLPTAWSIRSSASPTTPTPQNPNANSGESYLWFWHVDRANQDNPGTTDVNEAFVGDAHPYVTAQNANGIHFAQGPTEFGPAAAAPISRMYFEADFGSAITPRTYRTSKLIIESFNQ
jgi:hypothetical protein